MHRPPELTEARERSAPPLEPGTIPFNRPYLVGTETTYIEEAVRKGWLSAGGEFTNRCQRWLEQRTGSGLALITNSCTAGLEAAAILADLGPGDEIIMPSYTFVTTASAFALRGATPVFVDIEPSTLNLDPDGVRQAIGPRTKAIVPVHYAGIACDMKALSKLADSHGLLIIEDAAQGLLASFEERPLGTLGDLGAISFHETKNVTCGEGGALLVNAERFRERAEIIWEKGTDRRRFERGEIDKYTWVELGSTFGTSEVNAAFLWGQLEHAVEITRQRLDVWARYHEAFAEWEADAIVRRPIVPEGRSHNGHMYYLLLPDAETRAEFIAGMGARGVLTVFHYVPLHSSPAGSRLGRVHGDLAATDDLSKRLVRLPLWAGMDVPTGERVIEAAGECLSEISAG